MRVFTRTSEGGERVLGTLVRVFSQNCVGVGGGTCTLGRAYVRIIPIVFGGESV